MEASDEDVDARLDAMAAERGVPPADLRKLAREQGWYEALRSELIDRKALDFLVESAKVEDVSEAARS